MPKLKLWICSSLLALVSVAPVLAGTADATDAANPAATTANPAAQPATAANPNPTPTPGSPNVTALLGVLVMKGVLAPSEANSIRNAAPEAEFQLLVDALARKGVLSAADLSAAASPSPSSQPAASPVAAISSQAAPAPAKETKPAAPAIVAGVAPLRTLPLDPPVHEGLVPAFKIGAIKVTPYGFIKATVVHDSSDPNGDDFPFPGIWLNSSDILGTGPTRDPNFHIKARASRFGVNFEWPDIAQHLTLTGRVEGDLEGGFTEVDNADVSSIRNPQPRLRLAYVRLDYATSDRTDLFFEGGQNWSLFGSTALPNILETTFLGAFSGDVWERTPQFRFGFVQKLGESDREFKFSPEIALMMPSTGQIYKLNNTLGGFEAQIGEGERQGADSGRPELEARALLQFKLDKAPGVAPAQLIWSGYEGRRTSITTGANLAKTDVANTFPNGFTNSSNTYGNQVAAQLPTRFATLVVSAYRGGDMRFMLAGQLNTYYSNFGGLYNVQSVPTVDNVFVASGGQYVGCTVPIQATKTCTTSGGSWKIASQHPIGAFGGFINLGLPLSRWFNADPKGHNAGWQLLLHAGKDQVVHSDQSHANGFGCASLDGTGCIGGLPLAQSRLLAATLYYKVNNWATFAFEQSQYQTKLLPDVGPIYTIAGTPATKWKDQRTEFGPIFTF